MTNLASVVSKDNVIKALEKALKEKPVLRKATKFLLKYKNEFFPPKEVIRLAALEKGIGRKDFLKYSLAGGPTTNKYLKRMGFEIIQFADWNFNKSETKEKRIARLCWNTNGWIMPSGKYGKSTNKETHEATHGYGHEEWLFDISKTIDGYHYGFLEPIRKQQVAYENKVFNVWLYTIDGEIKRRYWIGEIKNLEVITKEEAEEVKAKYIKKGWFEEMEEQIIASGANREGFSDWKGVDLFNVKYLPINLIANEPYIQIQENNPVNHQSRYSFAHFRDEFNVGKFDDDDTFSFNFSDEIDATEGDGSLKKKIHVQQAKAIEIIYLHTAIRDALTKELKKRYGGKNVTKELLAGYCGNKIDIVVKDKKDYIFYEIKSYTSLRISIREAIGQLMEYSLWIKQKKARQLIVITQPLYNFNDAKIYFNHLRDMYNIPLYYQSYDYEKNILSEIV